METLHEIIVGLLTNAIWALGGFVLSYIIKKTFIISVITEVCIIYPSPNKKSTVIAARAAAGFTAVKKDKVSIWFIKKQ
jgi:hypothetical protein